MSTLSFRSPTIVSTTCFTCLIKPFSASRAFSRADSTNRIVPNWSSTGARDFVWRKAEEIPIRRYCYNAIEIDVVSALAFVCFLSFLFLCSAIWLQTRFHIVQYFVWHHRLYKFSNKIVERLLSQHYLVRAYPSSLSLLYMRRKLAIFFFGSSWAMKLV